MRLSDFDYLLPDELIAQFPTPERTASRLMHVAGDSLRDLRFADFPGLVQAGDVLVFNDTKVIKARLFGRKESGGRVEILVERMLSPHAVLAFVRASKTPRVGGRIRLGEAVELTVAERQDDLFLLRCPDNEDFANLLDRHGTMPLPPYIDRAPAPADETRYQTVYASTPGAVAAPTAGLHFDKSMLAKLDEMGVRRARVTLHVGAGTFQPVRVENLAEHKMHREWFSVPEETVTMIAEAHAEGRGVLAVGTTSLRALESAARGGALQAGSAETDLFIRPGYRFRVVDRLLTNFHLPRSTLLMLVAAFGGYHNLRAAYRHAVEARYRFFSYGDAMLIERHDAV